MQPLTQSLFNISRKAAKQLQRDFFELELLQNSKRNTNEFVNKSYLRTRYILEQELRKHLCPIFFAEDSINLEGNFDKAIVVKSLEGIENFSKSLSFFGIVIIYLKKINNIWKAFNFILNLPALSEIYYAEKGGGIWIEKYYINDSNKIMRLRSSNCQVLEEAMIGTSQNISNLNINYASQVRNIGSIYNMLGLLASGKLDSLYLILNSVDIDLASSLIAEECGAIKFTSSNKCLIGSHLLVERLKQLII